MGGGAAQWLCEALGIMATPADIGPLAAQAPDNGGVYFVPALTGLGAPYWDPYARGLLIGLTRGTGPAHLARATEEAICLQTRAVLEAMQSASGAKVATLRADGGAAADDFLLQLQADLLGVPVKRPRIREIHGAGSGGAGRLGSRFLDRGRGGRTGRRRQVFQPGMEQGERDRLFSEWQRAVERSLRLGSVQSPVPRSRATCPLR